MNKTEQVAEAAFQIERVIRAAADQIAEGGNMDNMTTLRELWRAVTTRFEAITGRQRQTSFDGDSRAAQWRCRFRLYDTRRSDDEPLADSDPELSPEQAGTVVIAGLPAVGDMLAQMAVAFHRGAALRGLSTDDLDRRLRGLRPTLSRRHGSATWRVPYDTEQTWRAGADHAGAYVARVDIERVKT